MVEKRNRLLELMEFLKLPLTPDEAEEYVKNLSEEDVDLLVSTYEDILNYENALSEAAEFADPKSYGKVFEEYSKKVEENESNYLEEKQKLQEDYDNRLDEAENESLAKLDESVDQYNNTNDKLEEARDDLYSRLNKAVS